MKTKKRNGRRLLTAGAGVAAFTAVEGLACGNPVHPRYDPLMDRPPQPTATTAVDAPDAGDSSTDAAPQAPDAAP